MSKRHIIVFGRSGMYIGLSRMQGKILARSLNGAISGYFCQILIQIYFDGVNSWIVWLTVILDY